MRRTPTYIFIMLSLTMGIFFQCVEKNTTTSPANRSAFNLIKGEWKVVKVVDWKNVHKNDRIKISLNKFTIESDSYTQVLDMSKLSENSFTLDYQKILDENMKYFLSENVLVIRSTTQKQKVLYLSKN